MQYDKTIYEKSKFSDSIPCNCSKCNKEITKSKKHIYLALKREGKYLFCSKECQDGFSRIRPIEISCRHCGKPTKFPNVFCDRKCYGQSKMGENRVEREEMKCDCCLNTYFLVPYKAKIAKNQKHHFCSKKCSSIFNFNPNNLKNDIVKKEVKEKKLKTKIKKSPEMLSLICSQCLSEFNRMAWRQNKNKHPHVFCSKSCRMKYFNIHYQISKSSGKQTSFPEDYLFGKLVELFPKQIIQRNVRTFLDCGYEMDIFFPELKFAIEVNGPVHYMPIYGQKRLDHAKFKDSIKYTEMHNKGISFIIIDVSASMSKKKYITYLDAQLAETIIPIINSIIVDS